MALRHLLAGSDINPQIYRTLAQSCHLQSVLQPPLPDLLNPCRTAALAYACRLAAARLAALPAVVRCMTPIGAAKSLSSSCLAQIGSTTLSSEVYGPSEDSFALADALLDIGAAWTVLPRLVVEIGCGSGYVITSAARIVEALGGISHLVGTDLSAPALKATQRTAAAHKVASTFDLVQADLLGPLGQRLQHKVDLLLFNPPYVPTPDEEMTRGGIAASWAGGARGRVVIDRLLPQVPYLLSQCGEMLMVTVAENDPKGILQEMTARGLKGRAVLTRWEDEELLTILHFHR